KNTPSESDGGQRQTRNRGLAVMDEMQVGCDKVKEAMDALYLALGDRKYGQEAETLIKKTADSMERRVSRLRIIVGRVTEAVKPNAVEEKKAADTLEQLEVKMAGLLKGKRAWYGRRYDHEKDSLFRKLRIQKNRVERMTEEQLRDLMQEDRTSAADRIREAEDFMEETSNMRKEARVEAARVADEFPEARRDIVTLVDQLAETCLESNKKVRTALSKIRRPEDALDEAQFYTPDHGRGEAIPMSYQSPSKLLVPRVE
ncbi:MAG: hypothetical protein AN484_26820, partial [Aphanizomenon flos-aquae WA102]